MSELIAKIGVAAAEAAISSAHAEDIQDILHQQGGARKGKAKDQTKKFYFNISGIAVTVDHPLDNAFLEITVGGQRIEKKSQ